MFVLVATLMLSAASPPDAEMVGPPATQSDVERGTMVANENAQPTAIDAEPIAETELGDLRAGDDTHVFIITDQTLDAVNSGNSVVADVVGSGAVTLSPNAFSGYNGIGNFVINTGHNNNLQGSISVSIAAPPQ